MFFTLSGFLLTSLALVEHDRSGGLGIRAFWVRRARRLIPASIVALALALWAVAVAVPAAQQSAAVGDIRAALFQVANWRFIAQGAAYADLHTVPSPVQHYWSLAIEEQFYLVFPVLAAACLRRRRAWLGLAFTAMVVLSVVQQVHLDGVDRRYFGTDTRVAELAIGGLLALAAPRLRLALGELRRWRLPDLAGIGALAVLAGCLPWLAVGRAGVTGGGLAVLGVVSAMAVVGAVEGDLVRRALSLRPLVELGRISYGVYVYHFPLFLLLDRERVHLHGWPLFLVRVAVTLGLSFASSRLLELPVRTGRALRGRVAPLALAGAFAVVLLVALPVGRLGGPERLAFEPVGRGGPPSTSSSTTAAGSGGPETTAPAGGTPGGPGPSRPATTVAPARPPRIVVVGDSTAGANGAGLKAWGERTGRLQVVTVYEPGCGALYGPRFVVRDGYEFQPQRCDSLFSRARAAAVDLDADAIVVFIGSAELADWQLDGVDGLHHLGDATFDGRYRRALGGALAQLTGAGRPVLWSTVALPQWDLDKFSETIGTPVPGSGPITLNDPPRTARINALDAPIVPGYGLAQLVPYAERLQRADGSVPARIRPDGLHLSVEGVAEIADAWLYAVLGDAFRLVTARHPAGLGPVDRQSWSAPGAPLAPSG